MDNLPPGVSHFDIDKEAYDCESEGHDYVKGPRGWHCRYCDEEDGPEHDD